ncbi:MAG TPA: sulfite exporter TauE/SafE family protein [Gammaproteobacteria bacterium]|nr:sulfite exporter TauE/SafE family protein [Gammaproteobacteria bacterium]
MDAHSNATVLSLAFGLGLLHALDADHIMAVTGLASTRPGWRTSLAFCGRWAVGHGLSLVTIGAGVLLLGMAIPVRLSATAEHLVGVVLVAIGAWVLWDLVRKRAHLHFHRHDGMPGHAHWHQHHGRAGHDERAHRHGHRAVLVGLLHGTAGSAPLLALIPLAKMGSPWVGLAYLLVFSLGVLSSMLVFGGLLGGVYGWLNRWGERGVRAVRGLVGMSSIAFGGYLLVGLL